MKKKKIILILIMGIILTGSFFTFQVSAQATDPLEYTVLAPLPCIDGSGIPGTKDYNPNCTQTSNKTTLEKYLPGVFKLAIGLAAVWAVLMIVLGGIQYISTDAIFKKEEGRKRIENAIYGLVLVIAAALILKTINPNLLEINLNIEPAVTKAPAGGTLGLLMAPAQIEESNARKMMLKGWGINVYGDKGPCTQGQTVDCVNLNGLPPNAVTGLRNLGSACKNCTLNMSGGTEGGHKSHGVGSPNVDFLPSSSLGSYLSQFKESGQTNNGAHNPVGLPNPTTIRVNENGVNAVFTFEKKGDNGASGDHWHVTFK